MNTVLFVDDEEKILDLMSMHFEKTYRVVTAKDGIEALKELKSSGADLVVTDVKMPRMDGMRLLREIKDSAGIPVIVVTAFGTIESAVGAMREGAYDYISKPLNLKDLEMKMKRALEYVNVRRENDALRARIRDTSGIITRNVKMIEILKKIPEYAATDLPVLILGESGTGKELVAREIHAKSGRYINPFIPVNMSAIPTELFESEFFGYEKGAFTGANSQKTGKFEAAHDGTLFLDEIGEMPTEHQAKLLRVLQDSKITRLGGTGEKDVNFRLICATNKKLDRLIESKEFRQDLYYRINVIRIDLPPLRERVEDIEAITLHYVGKYSGQFKKKVKTISPKTLEVLKGYEWPGNVRELENVVLRTIINTDSEEIRVNNLPDEFKNDGDIADYKTFLSVKKAEREKLYAGLERRFVASLLARSGGNVSRAAEIADMDRRLLQNMIKEINDWQS